MNFDREMPLVLIKIPLVLIIIIGSIPIIVGIFYSYYSTSANVKNKEEFYKAEFSSVVIRSNTSEGRTTEFHLENNLKIYFWLSAQNPLSIGDSIQKVKDTYLYSVYRKDINGVWKFYATYDFLKME